jgi:hypothetical protein
MRSAVDEATIADHTRELLGNLRKSPGNISRLFREFFPTGADRGRPGKRDRPAVV